MFNQDRHLFVALDNLDLFSLTPSLNAECTLLYANYIKKGRRGDEHTID